MENLAIVDLGSNSARMAITEIAPDGRFREIKRVKENTRLSEGMGREKMLQEDAMNRTIAALKRFKKIYEGMPHTQVRAITTAAVRQARNRQEFLNRVQKEVGIRLQVLSGKKEAYYDYLGVIRTMKLNHCLILDVGGASCELVLVQQRRARDLISIPVGAVTLSEQFHLNGYVRSADLFRAQVAMNERLTKIPWLRYATRVPIVLLGGANRTLARMTWSYHHRHRRQRSIHGYQLSSRVVFATYRELLNRNLAQRKQMPGLEPERADIIVGGMLPLVSLLQRNSDGRVIFSESGVREGIITEYVNQRKRPQ
ncbi:Ppx/GppA family phosphatase [Limosilactobacillus pontis]|uniref:Ppx/GppA family phosphatase n=1 Tax=Limosilactobacillus pontis TaxID=35787 RepID=A0ABT7UXQ1_9LACO|nr:Ppx/GppA family phosphatase [Limosilactobacillus pontis]MDM8266464.1 Ppx/GppA family phosphatase [Limosilactobacillus pontis]HJA74675.1 Ppx/GppA family phosphatase [Candidatus Limosilactobacillus gallistercoris]